MPSCQKHRKKTLKEIPVPKDKYKISIKAFSEKVFVQLLFNVNEIENT